MESPRSPHQSEQRGDSTAMKVKSFTAERDWQEMEQAIDCELAHFVNIESRRSGNQPKNILADVVNHWRLKQDIINWRFDILTAVEQLK